jgi:hypothetical protein
MWNRGTKSGARSCERCSPFRNERPRLKRLVAVAAIDTGTSKLQRAAIGADRSAKGKVTDKIVVRMGVETSGKSLSGFPGRCPRGSIPDLCCSPPFC